MKHLFIINPAAGKGKGLELIDIIKSYFKDNPKDCCIEITKYPGHAYNIAKDYSSRGSFRMYSIGGDGTLNEIINGIIDTDSSVASIPAGSGNDFIKSICEYDDLEDILKKMIHGTERKIDAAQVDNKYYINISSLGFDGEVTYNANKLKKYKFIPKKLCYLLGVFITLIKFDIHKLHITIDGKQIYKECLFIVIANGKYYGGGMEPAPQAHIDDGELDICIIDRMSRFRILTLFPLFMKGKHMGIRGIEFYRGKNIKINSEKDFILNIDGDVKRVMDVEFNIKPNSVNIIIPKE